MLKKVGLLLTILLFLGCGSSNTSSSTISDREKVSIIHDLSEELCSNPLFKDYLKDQGLKNILITSTNNDVNCNSYGKTEGNPDDLATECVESTLADMEAETGEDLSEYEDFSKACVIGFDL